MLRESRKKALVKERGDRFEVPAYRAGSHLIRGMTRKIVSPLLKLALSD